MPRTIKPPWERREEIVATALSLFSTQGYERTTIQDIAQKMGVSQGLCYRYFKSKEQIYEAALAAYVAAGVDACARQLESNALPLLKKLEQLDLTALSTGEKGTFHAFINSTGNEAFHTQMLLLFSKGLCPLLTQLIEAEYPTRGDAASLAAFCAYGQLGVFFAEGEASPQARKHALAYIQQLLATPPPTA